MITITDKAKSEIQLLRTQDKLDNTYHLRVSVVAGGCSGLSYKLSFDNEVLSNDTVCEDNGETVLVDNKSLLYLFGTELNYSDGLNGKGFEFNNPNANRTCGCGESFGI